MTEPHTGIHAPGEAEMMDETIPLLPRVEAVSPIPSGMSREKIFALLTTLTILAELAMLGVSPQTQVCTAQASYPCFGRARVANSIK